MLKDDSTRLAIPVSHCDSTTILHGHHFDASAILLKLAHRTKRGVRQGCPELTLGIVYHQPVARIGRSESNPHFTVFIENLEVPCLSVSS